MARESEIYRGQVPQTWLGVELRHLVALRLVAEERSFKRAARRLGYTQSAISQQIATLERLVGQKLILRPRGANGVSLTEAGELMLRHANAIASRVTAAKADMDALAVGGAGVLRVGAFQTIGARILPELLHRFLPAWPDVSIRLTETIADVDLITRVERGELDVAFGVLPLPEGPFESVELLPDPFRVAVAADSPLGRDGAIPLAQLANMPLVCFRSCRVTQRVLDQLRSEGLEPLVVFRSDQNETLQGAAAAGDAAALMPELSIDCGDPRTRGLAIAADLPVRIIAAIWHANRELTPFAAAFVDVAREVCAGLTKAA